MTDSVKWKIIRTNGTVLIGEYLGLNDNATTASRQQSLIKIAAFDLVSRAEVLAFENEGLLILSLRTRQSSFRNQAQSTA